MFEVRILALIYREIEAIRNGIAGPYLVHIQAPEPRQGLQIFDLNSRQMGGQLRGEIEWDGFVAKVAKILCNLSLRVALIEEERRRKSRRKNRTATREERELGGSRQVRGKGRGVRT